MYKHRFPQLFILFSGLFFCIIGTSNPLYGTDDIEQSDSSEDTTANNETEDQTTKPHYYIRQLRFDGSSHFNQNRLANLFEWQSEKTYTQAEIREGFERILEAYRKDGFVFVEMTPAVSPILANETDVSITVKIVEGKRIRIGVLTLTGNQLFSEEEIHDTLNLKQDNLFTEAALADGIERVQTLYSEHGYPKIEIETKNIQLSSETSTVDFQLHIREGSQIRIGDVKVSGLQKTKTEVVLREIPCKAMTNVLINAILIQVTADCGNLGYFYQINPNVLEAGATADRINFHAHVTEAKTGRLSGVIGYAPPDSEVDGAPDNSPGFLKPAKRIC